MTEKIFIISLLVFAVHYTLQPGEIFGRLGDWLHKVLPERLQEPVYGCVICMTPWHGTVLYWLIWGASWQEWLIVVIAAMGLNSIINPIIHRDE